MSTTEWLRVDDRLIHGQVMVGWVVALNIREIIIANDNVAHDAWRGDVLSSAVGTFSDEVKLTLLSLEDAVSYMRKTTKQKRILLVESLPDACELYKRGLMISRLNLGGIHFRKGRVELLPFLYLDSGEMSAILELADKGVIITAQDLPLSRVFDVVELIKKKKL